MDSQATPKQQAAEQLKNASSILVTTGKNPNVDEVASAIGLTYMLQNMNKHATAVISTHIPEVLEFLKPYETIETTTDRLRDFVITFSKDKADKLRYKVVDDDVRIFITPYKTILTKDDLTFTQGDYNIDTVIVLGATKRNELDDAVLEHSRILSDSTVVTINAGGKVPSVGTINWHDPDASSVAEMLVSISEALASGLLTKKSSQALLTGLVSATGQFSNSVTTPKVMTMAAQLMAAGADQQQIVKAFEAQTKPQPVQESTTDPTEPTVEFSHPDNGSAQSMAAQQQQSAAPQSSQDQQGSQSSPTLAKPQNETNNSQPQSNFEQLVQQANQTNSPRINVDQQQNDTIVLEGGSETPQQPEDASQKQQQGPAIRSDKRQRLDEKPKQDLDNPILSQPPTTNTDQPALNANDHSFEDMQAQAQPEEKEPILSHPEGEDRSKGEGNQLQQQVPAKSSEPHVNVHPDTPVLQKPQPQQPTVSNQQASQQQQSPAQNQPQAPQAQPPKPAETPQEGQQQSSSSSPDDALAAARQAVEQAADSQPPSLPKPIESLSAQEMQPNEDGSISIDHDGNIQSQ